MEESKIYQYLKSREYNSDYLNKYNRGLELLERKNKRYEYEKLKLNLDCFSLLKIVYYFIRRQTGDIQNRNKKLLVIDEYARINRYKNDGKIWTSGVCTSINDIFNYSNYNCSVIIFNNNEITKRDKNDVGLKQSLFVKYISDFDYHYEYKEYQRHRKQSLTVKTGGVAHSARHGSS